MNVRYYTNNKGKLVKLYIVNIDRLNYLVDIKAFIDDKLIESKNIELSYSGKYGDKFDYDDRTFYLWLTYY